MNDPFQTPPAFTTMPSISDVIRISKKTLISLLLDLPIQELFLKSNIISDDDSDSATLNFIHELGRALSNVRITSFAPKASPKKRLSASINPRPTEPSLRVEQPSPTRPQIHSDNSPDGVVTGLAADVDDPVSSLKPQNPMPDPQKREEYEIWRRQEMKREAKAMLEETNLDEEAIISRSTLESIQWDHPPRFQRLGRDDPRRKRMIEEMKTFQYQDPYYMARIARHPPQKHPFVFVRGEVTDIETGDETGEEYEDEYEVATLAMWDSRKLPWISHISLKD